MQTAPNYGLVPFLAAGKVGATFDKNGNTLTFDLDRNGRSDEGDENPDGYDWANRLIAAKRGASTIQIMYDGDGNRVQKTVDGKVTKYLMDDRNPTGYSQVLEERDGSGKTLVTYIYGLDLVSITRRTGAPGSQVSQTHYYGYDGLGSVRYLTDGNITLGDGTTPNPDCGAITDIYTYDAFGILLPDQSSGSTDNQYLYTGEQYDPDLGMYYLRARYYSPQIGRFWTSDTYEGKQTDPLSLHKYLYCHANPVSNVDPSGHSLIEQLFVGVTQMKLRYKVAVAVAAVYVGAKWEIERFRGHALDDEQQERLDAALKVLKDPALKGNYEWAYARIHRAPTRVVADAELLDKKGAWLRTVTGFDILQISESSLDLHPTVLAAGLVHEAYHMSQWWAGLKTDLRLEGPAWQVTANFFRDIAFPGPQSWGMFSPLDQRFLANASHGFRYYSINNAPF